MVLVREDITFYNVNGVKHQGFYMDGYLKTNIDDFLIRAVKNKWDGVMLVTGMEGSGKSTGAFAIANYLDPTFPGEPLNDGTPRRKCTRIVFTPQQFMEAVDNSKPEQSIVWDEFVLGGLSVDAMTTMQRLIVKKMVTIRKKRLYILLVIPTIFLLKKYFAMLRTRALIHFYTPDGVARGYFKFYNYQTKNTLFVKGLKEWNMGVAKPNFKGRATNTEGYFLDIMEYDQKKEEAITNLTEEPAKKKKEQSEERLRMGRERDIFFTLYYTSLQLQEGGKFTYIDYGNHLNQQYGLDFHEGKIGKCIRNGKKLLTTEVKLN